MFRLPFTLKTHGGKRHKETDNISEYVTESKVDMLCPPQQ